MEESLDFLRMPQDIEVGPLSKSIREKVFSSM